MPAEPDTPSLANALRASLEAAKSRREADPDTATTTAQDAEAAVMAELDLAPDIRLTPAERFQFARNVIAVVRPRIVAEARADLLDRIVKLASQLHAAIPADHPKGAQASFADWLRINAADLLDGATDA